MGFIELHGVSKSFGHNAVVRELSMQVGKGEFVSFLGGSGCGKTTTLRMIAGFETPSSGKILIDGVNVSNIPPAKRNLGMVFQNYALFPNMTVRKNIGFGLKILKKSRSEIEQRVDEMLDLIHMSDFDNRYPHQLSGGQQQRVALARAIAVKPTALLLDEPLSALDAKIRLQLRDDIKAIQQKLGITTIYVTHDQEEALSISDRVAVMREGKIEQIGTPFEIYNKPATSYVASFIGTLNVLEGKVVDPEKGIVAVDSSFLRIAGSIKENIGNTVRLTIRPEAVSLCVNGMASNADANFLSGTVENTKFMGSTVRLVIKSGNSFLFMDCFNNPHMEMPKNGQQVTITFSHESCRILPSDQEGHDG